jgi:prepilin signal peptidase PulO-like enzyme (type II secretory pathway)
MEAPRYVIAALVATAVAAAVHVWLNRTRRGQGVEGRPNACLPPKAAPDVLGQAGVWLWHAAVLVPLSLMLAWLDRTASLFGFMQSLLLLCLLYPLAVLDWYTLQVELRLVLGGLLLRLAGLLVFDRARVPEAMLGMLAGAGTLALAALAYRAVRGRAGLGEGDAGVMAIAGAFTGWNGLLPVLLLAAAAGSLLGLAALLLLRKPLDTPIPFVPFLCAATLAVHAAQRLGWLAAGLGY